MWMDIVVALIFVISTAAGFRRGFLHTFLHTLGWVLSIALSFVCYTAVEGFLRANTNLYGILYDKIAQRTAEQGSYAASSFTAGMPSILQDFIDSIKNSVAAAIASGVSDYLFKIICFLSVAIVIRFIFLLLCSLISKKHNDGLLGFIDGIFGLLAGAVKGLLLIFLLLAFLVPIISLFPGDSLITTLESSKIAGVLYDNNYLLLFLKGLF